MLCSCRTFLESGPLSLKVPLSLQSMKPVPSPARTASAGVSLPQTSIYCLLTSPFSPLTGSGHSHMLSTPVHPLTCSWHELTKWGWRCAHHQHPCSYVETVSCLHLVLIHSPDAPGMPLRVLPLWYNFTGFLPLSRRHTSKKIEMQANGNGLSDKFVEEALKRQQYKKLACQII